MRTLLLRSASAFGALAGTWGVAQMTPEELKGLLTVKVAEFEAPVVTLQDRYEAELQQLDAAAQKEGKLEAVAKLREEMNGFRNPNHSNLDAYGTFPNLGRARDVYRKQLWLIKDAARPKQIELYKAYLERLADMRTDLTKSGQIETALRLEAEQLNTATVLSRLESMQRWKGKGAFEKTVLWELSGREDLVPNGEVSISDDPGCLKLSSSMEDMGRYETAQRFKPPIRLIARAATDSTSVRLYYGAGLLVIFNWESRPDELRIHDPNTGAGHMGYKDKGSIETNRFYDFEARITDNRISIYVDGALRTSRQGDFKSAEGPVGVGPAFGGIVSLEAMAVFAED